MTSGSSVYSKKNELGSQGEAIAASYLVNKGYAILDRNYRCKLGEIDIIAGVDEYLVFVEVKTRLKNKMEIDPLISITRYKQQKLRDLGTFYIQQKSIYTMQPRFDVVAISLETVTNYQLRHIENAF